MLQIISLERNRERLRMSFDLDGDKCGEYNAVLAIFTALVEQSYGVEIKFNMRTATTFGAWREKPTEWIYWAEDGTLEVADPSDNSNDEETDPPM